MVPLYAAKKFTKNWIASNGRRRYAKLFKEIGAMFGANPKKPCYRIVIPIDKAFVENAKYSPVEADVMNVFHGTKFRVENYYLGQAFDTKNNRVVTIESALTQLNAKDHDKAAKAATYEQIAAKLEKLIYSIPGDEPGDSGKKLKRYTKINKTAYTAYDEKLRKTRTFDELRMVLEWTRTDRVINKVRDDSVRQNSTLVDKGGMAIVITRHPVDVMALSTGRAWDKTSCLRLEYSKHGRGGNAHYIQSMVNFGALVIYGIKIDDKNIEHPVCRATLCPFINTKNPDDVILLQTSRKYGEPFPGYIHAVNKFLDIVNAGNDGGSYKIAPKGFYSDVPNEQKHPVWSQDNNIDAWCKSMGIKKYRIRPDKKVDVDGDVTINLDSRELSSGMLPIRFGRVTGNFIATKRDTAYDPDWFNKPNQRPATVSGIGLTCLKGFPEYVGGVLDISGNPLETLDGAPEYVGSHFLMVHMTDLKSLQGMPRYVGGNLDASSSALRSLRGATGAVIDGSLILAYTKITHLDAKPTVGRSYCLSFTSLRTTLGLPDTVNEDLLMRNCSSVRDLLGMPKLIKRNFSATECVRLVDLRGLSETRINGSCWFNLGSLTTLDYYPAYVGGTLQLYGHRLARDTKHPPTLVGPLVLGRKLNPKDKMADPDHTNDDYYEQLQPGEEHFFSIVGDDD